MNSDSEAETFYHKDATEMVQEIEPMTPRRLTRNRTKPKKYDEFLETSPTKRKTFRNIQSTDEEMEEVDKPKPTALFGDGDVDGQDMFKFKSRHTKHDLHNKVKEALSNSPALPQTPRTPIKSIKINLKELATPRQVVNKLKKRIIQEVESDSAESDFSGSSSDFVPDKSDESESSQSGSDEEAEEQEQARKPVKLKTATAANRRARQKDSEYFVTPDNYFMMNSSKKIATSDHTLSRLKNLNLEDGAHESYLSAEHERRADELTCAHAQLFDRWLYALGEGFNVLLYGLGSKRAVLQRFQTERLQSFPCVVVNGFFQSLTVKSILETIVVDLLESPHVPPAAGDVISLVDARLRESGARLFLLLHNIDGPALRGARAQALLAGLAQLPSVHLVATIDHINAPLLWDHSKLSKFRFSWWDASTFLPYGAEAGEAALARAGPRPAALRSVARALTANARGVFRLLAEHQLAHRRPHYPGLSFKELYWKAREQFLVSSDLALRAQLTEFLDHKLVRYRRAPDAGDHLVIPIDDALLRQFLDENIV